ncbi:hypothetical protein C8F04DRAFT_1238015 [Mycena alexandri]|uniref:Uncharacterized protein n=1 Tax=Mycena alexandri TaxID=1745969 RepID=A0AAD6SII9_9AGAR|nr:hypothetical protein C8F04DRAFT_1238015 [Mycena alexandri]
MARSGKTAPSPHSTRNPGRQVQLSRRRPGISRAHRASQALRLEGPRRKKRELEDEIDEEFSRRAKAIAQIALQFSKKIPYIRNILACVSQYKATKVPSLHHAVVHQRWLDLQAQGKTQSLHEIKQSLKEEIESGELDMDDFDEEEKARLITQVLDHRMLKRRGVRSTTRAVELDVKQTAGGIGNALGDLHFRTGVCGFALLSRGHADDPSKPHFVDSNDAMAYLIEVYGISPYDFLRGFEAWSTTRDNGIVDKDDLGSMRKLVSKLLTDSLRRIKHNNNISMDYVNYEVAIREGKGVELAGWPADISMSRPALWNAETTRRVRDALRSGAIHWVTMPRAQHGELIAANNAKRAAEGSGALRKRAVRSDSGTMRGPNKRTAKKKAPATSDDDEDDDEEHVPPPPQQAIPAPAPIHGDGAPSPFPSLRYDPGAAPTGADEAPTYPSLHYDPVPHVIAQPDLDALLGMPDLFTLPPLDPTFDAAEAQRVIDDFLADIEANGIFPEVGTLGQQVFANASAAPAPSNGFPTAAFTPAPLPTQVLGVASSVNLVVTGARSNTAAGAQNNATPPMKKRKVRSDAGASRKAKIPRLEAQNDAASAALPPPPRKRKVRSDAGVRKKK